ncbi:hypothetical protein JCM11251_000927 [Rhodosporidiobolus azoricus]
MPSALLYLAIFVPVLCLFVGLLAAHLYYRRIRALVRSVQQRQRAGREGGDLTIREVEEANAVEMEVLQRMEQECDAEHANVMKKHEARATVRTVQGSDETTSLRPPFSSRSSTDRRPAIPSAPSSKDRQYRLVDLARLEQQGSAVKRLDVGDEWARYEPMSASEREEVSGTDTAEVSASSDQTGKKASTFTRSSLSLPHPFEFDPSPPFGSPRAPTGTYPVAVSSSKHSDSRSRSRFSFFPSASEGDSSDTRGSRGGESTASDSRATTNSRGQRVLRRGSRRSLRPPHAPEPPSVASNALRAIKAKSRGSLSMGREKKQVVPLPGEPLSPTRAKKRRRTFGVGEGEDTDNDADESDSLVQAGEKEEAEGGAMRRSSRSSTRRTGRRQADETIKAHLSPCALPEPVLPTAQTLAASPTSTSRLEGAFSVPLSRSTPPVTPQPQSSLYSSADFYSIRTFPPLSGSEEQSRRTSPAPVKKHNSGNLPPSLPPAPPASPPSQRTFAPTTLFPAPCPSCFTPSPRPPPCPPTRILPIPLTAAPVPPRPTRHPASTITQRSSQNRDGSAETAQSSTLSRCWTTVAQQGSATSTPFIDGHRGDPDQDLAFAIALEEAHPQYPAAGTTVGLSRSQAPSRGGHATSGHSRAASATGSVFHEHLSDEGAPLVDEPASVEEDEGRESLLDLDQPSCIDRSWNVQPCFQPTNPDSSSLYTPSLLAASSLNATTNASPSIYSKSSSYLGSVNAGAEQE